MKNPEKTDPARRVPRYVRSKSRDEFGRLRIQYDKPALTFRHEIIKGLSSIERRALTRVTPWDVRELIEYELFAIRKKNQADRMDRTFIRRGRSQYTFAMVATVREDAKFWTEMARRARARLRQDGTWREWLLAVGKFFAERAKLTDATQDVINEPFVEVVEDLRVGEYEEDYR